MAEGHSFTFNVVKTTSIIYVAVIMHLPKARAKVLSENKQTCGSCRSHKTRSHCQIHDVVPPPPPELENEVGPQEPSTTI